MKLKALNNKLIPAGSLHHRSHPSCCRTGFVSHVFMFLFVVFSELAACLCVCMCYFSRSGRWCNCSSAPSSCTSSRQEEPESLRRSMVHLKQLAHLSSLACSPSICLLLLLLHSAKGHSRSLPSQMARREHADREGKGEEEAGEEGGKGGRG